MPSGGLVANSSLLLASSAYPPERTAHMQPGLNVWGLVGWVQPARPCIRGLLQHLHTVLLVSDCAPNGGAARKPQMIFHEMKISPMIFHEMKISFAYGLCQW